MTLTIVEGASGDLFDATDPVLRQFLKLEDDETDNNNLLSAFCASARQFAETYTRRRFLTQTLELRRDRFGWGRIDLETGPVRDIVKVSYLDGAGEWQDVPVSVYRLLTSTEPASVGLRFGQTWPVPLQEPDSVAIQFRVGYGDDVSDVPADILHAVRLLAAHYYEHRDAMAKTGTVAAPFGVTAQLNPYRIWV